MWVLFIFALFIAGAYFLPMVAKVERSKTIDASAKVVFAQINDLHSWEKWSKWNQIDPEMKIDFINKGVGEGAGYRWESANKSVGSGELVILESLPYDSIVILFDIKEQGNARSVFLFSEQDSTTLVTWKMDYDVGYNPAARWMGLMLDKYAGPDFEEGLENLNVVCKVQVQENSFIEELEMLQEFNYASIRKEVSFVEVSLQMEEMYEQVSSFIEEKNVGITGSPFAVYHKMEGERIDLECGIPISKLVEGNQTINSAIYPTKQCAVVDYFGDYRQLEDAHTALQSWIEERKFKLAGPPLEFYLTDPEEEPNSEKWHTRIYYPVR
jgi:effector-binding domain-containing protein